MGGVKCTVKAEFLDISYQKESESEREKERGE
jgi:hypothetical protein